jgi:hypothetical protein
MPACRRQASVRNKNVCTLTFSQYDTLYVVHFVVQSGKSKPPNFSYFAPQLSTSSRR